MEADYLVSTFDSAFKKLAGGGFVEEGTMIHEGRRFTSGGSFMAKNSKTGKYEAVLYHHEDGTIGTWDGKKKWAARYGREWEDNMGSTRVSLTTVIDGRRFSGTWFKSQGDLVRLRETK